MKTHLKVLGRTLFYVGLCIALVFGFYGLSSLKAGSRQTAAITSMSELDQQAKPFFEEAERNIPKVVSALSGTKVFLNLCYLAVTDKITGSNKLEREIASVIEGPILAPCRKGAAVYGCGINSGLAHDSLSDIQQDAVTSALYAAGGLALEAVFLKPTMDALQRVIGPLIGKIAAKLGVGAACAAADGPLPIGDTIGAILAVGGSVWSIHDLLDLRRDLPDAIASALHQAIQEYWKQCRLEAIR